MKLLIIACLLAVASARPSEEQLGTERCTWGPAYWCKNYKHATECNAIEHCKEHVWKSNDLCSECKSTVGEIHDFAKNNGTEVLAYMKELCALVGEFAEECNMLVDLYGKTILSTVLNLTADSDKLCQELGLCSKSKQEIQHTLFKVFIAQLKTNPHMIHLKSVKADYCEDCKLVFAEIKDLLEDKAIQGDVVGLLEKLCAEFGSYASECKSLVDQYGPMIFEELASLDDPDAICSELGLCNSTKKVLAAHRLTPAKLPKLFFPMAPGPLLIDATELEKAKKIKSPKVSVECAVCEFAMKELDGILGDNATKEEIQEALDEVCSILPSTIRSECQDLINEYAPMIIKLLLEEVQPDQICTELGLCSGVKKLVRVALHKDFKTNDDTCELCKLVVGYLENILKSNATEDEIKKALEEICNMLPGELKTECNELVDKYTADLVWLITEVPPYSACKCDAIIQEYGDLLIKLILGELSPQEVCQELTLCQSGGNGFLKYKCFLGESYWCANYRNALKCQALVHCKFMA